MNRTGEAAVGLAVGSLTLTEPVDGTASAGETGEPKLSVLICTYKRPEGLRALLASLRPQVEGRADREAIVVNDGTDDEAYRAVLAEFPGVTYVPLPKNVGVAEARNEAARRARGAFIVFTDDDCVTPPWWLDWLQARLAFSPELDILAGTTVARPTANPSFLARVQSHYRMIPHAWWAGKRPMFATANVAIRRSLFRSLGGFAFSSAIGHVGEDTELAIRANLALARIAVDPDWVVSHEVGGSLWSHMRRYWRYGYANAEIARSPRTYLIDEASTTATRRGHFSHFIGQLRDSWYRSEGFSPRAPARAAAAVAATAIRAAYYDGCSAGRRPSRSSIASKEPSQAAPRPIGQQPLSRPEAS
jgi:GT2 family glycosyltransferase